MITLVPLGLAIATVTGRLRWPLARLFLVWIGFRVLRIVQQDTEAMQGGGMDVPVEEVMDVLRKE